MADCDALDANIPSDDNILIPDWFGLDIELIYDHLNPRTKQGITQSQSWHKKAVDETGKPLSSIGIVENRLLKILITRKLIPDTTLNSKLQTRKVEGAQQRLEFTRVGVDSNPQPAIMLIQKFLMENILVPCDADGNVVDVNNISANLGAHIIMLAVEPDSYTLNETFAAPDKEACRAQIDDKSLSFNEKWYALASNFFNADDFDPENIWADKDSRILDVDPWSAPTAPWTGENCESTFVA
jgi:hypothetical protein